MAALSTAAFTLQRQNGLVTIEAVWATQLKIFIWLIIMQILPTLELDYSRRALSCHHSRSLEPRKVWSLKGSLYQLGKK